MKQHDLVILTSGGYDSTLLLHLAKLTGFTPIALLIDYGQKHIRELESAQRLCDRLEVPYRKMTVSLTGVESGLTGGMTESLYQGVHSHHVPGRNSIFVGLAASLAEQVGAPKIWYGANMEDCINKFPDCMQGWVDAMNQSLKQADSFPMELEAPLLGMRKDTILRIGKSFGIKEEDVHSGYAV
jgi:7-cyano-7-deazaguanine synthase